MKAHGARLVRTAIAFGFVGLACGSASSAGAPQPAGGGALPRRLTIPYLANAAKPADLDFAAAECDVSEQGDSMTCHVRQLFVTVASFDPTACVITTNGYERRFDRQTPTRWISADPPGGDCGIVETATLDDGGGTRWTMTLKKSATRDAERPQCRAEVGAPEIYSWQNLKRALPCTTIQPGAIER